LEVDSVEPLVRRVSYSDRHMNSYGMSKRPRDPNKLAKLIVGIAIGETDDTISEEKKNPKARHGQAGGLKGGVSRAKALSPNQRRKIAVKAARARWKSGKDD